MSTTMDELEFPSHMLAPETSYQPRPHRPLWFLPIGRIITFVLISVPFYMILNRIAPRVPSLMWLFTPQVEYCAEALAVLYVVWKIVGIYIARARLRKASADCHAALNEGNLAQAASRIEEVCRSTVRYPPYHAQAVLLRAEVFMREGRVDRALSLLAAIHNSRQFSVRKRAALRAELLNLLALCFAVKGDLDGAEQWAGMAHDVVPPERMGSLLPLQMIIGVRRNRHSIVLKDAESDWPQAARVLDPHMLAGLSLLCAFAASRLDTLRSAELENKIQRWIGEARRTPTPLDWMGFAWPELREFLRVHALLGAAAPPPPSPEPAKA